MSYSEIDPSFEAASWNGSNAAAVASTLGTYYGASLAFQVNGDKLMLSSDTIKITLGVNEVHVMGPNWGAYKSGMGTNFSKPEFAAKYALKLLTPVGPGL